MSDTRHRATPVELAWRDERGEPVRCPAAAGWVGVGALAYRRERVALRALRRHPPVSEPALGALEVTPCHAGELGSHYHVRHRADGPWRRPMPAAPGSVLPWTPRPVAFCAPSRADEEERE